MNIVFRALSSLIAFLSFRSNSIRNNNNATTFFGNYYVSECSSDTVTISSRIDDAISDLLKPDQIIIQLSTGSDTTSNNNVCNSCCPLFRKVLSYEKDQGVYITTFVSFSDIFPREVYDESLAEEFIEPMFQCEHSTSIGTGTSNTTAHHRLLADSSGTIDTTGRSSFCDLIPFFSILISLASVLIVGLPLMVLWIPIIILLMATNTCGLTFDNVLGSVFAFGYAEKVHDNTEAGRKLQQQRHQLFSEEFPVTTTRTANTTDFPNKCEDWMSKSKVTGSCSYVDCNVGPNGNPTDCYSCGENCVSSSIKNNAYDFNGMINILHTEYNIIFDFSDSFCVHQYCYSSNTFTKETCDKHFYASLTAACQSSSALSAPPPSLMSTNNNKDQQQEIVEFPLNTNTLQQNCHILSALIYLGVKMFGRGIYSKQQASQLQYNKEGICDHMNDVKI